MKACNSAVPETMGNVTLVIFSFDTKPVSNCANITPFVEIIPVGTAVKFDCVTGVAL